MEAPEDINKDLKVSFAGFFWKFVYAQTQCSSEDAFCFFARSLTFLKTSISFCGTVVPQTHGGKMF